MLRFGNALATMVLLLEASPCTAGDRVTAPAWMSLHGQFTVVDQYHPSFHSPFEGTNSLAGRAQSKETMDATAFVGARLFDGLEIYVNPEIDQGFGLSNTVGLAGFSSG